MTLTLISVLLATKTAPLLAESGVNAINGYTAQSRRDIKAAVPKVGLTPATAMDGEYAKAI